VCHTKTGSFAFSSTLDKMRGHTSEENRKPKRFAKFRSVFKPKSRTSPTDPNESTSASPTRSPILASGSDPQTDNPDASTPRTSANVPSVVSTEGTGTAGPSTSETPATMGRPQETNTRTPFVVPSDRFGDRKATEERYKAAAERLKDSLKIRRANWKAFDIPTVSFDLSTNDPVPQLREQIYSTLEARRNSVENRDFWAKGKNIVEQTFTAMSPFAKNFLIIARQGAAVSLFDPSTTNL